MLKASYRLKSGERPGGGNGPGGAYDKGSFAQDYEFVKKTAGDLDDCNGRHGVTPEYPQGTYYYVITDNWPFIPVRSRARRTARAGMGGPGGPVVRAAVAPEASADRADLDAFNDRRR